MLKKKTTKLSKMKFVISFVETHTHNSHYNCTTPVTPVI